MIRPARPADLDALLELQAAWPSLPRWSRDHFAAELPGLYVAEDGGRLAGYAALRALPPEGEVTVVAVAPDQLRRGVARRLLERLHELAAEAGCVVIGLEVSAANAPAIALYGAMGYQVVGRRKRYYPDGSDALLMTRR